MRGALPAAAVRRQTLVAGTLTSATTLVNGEGCSRGDLGCLGSVVAKAEAGAVGAQGASPCPGCRRCDVPEGEFESKWKDGCGWWRREDASKAWLRGASPIPGRDALHSVLWGWGEGWEPSAESHQLCRKERSASCPAVPVRNPVMPAGTRARTRPSQACWGSWRCSKANPRCSWPA